MSCVAYKLSNEKWYELFPTPESKDSKLDRSEELKTRFLKIYYPGKKGTVLFTRKGNEYELMINGKVGGLWSYEEWEANYKLPKL